MNYGQDHPDAEQWADEEGNVHGGQATDEPISVVAFPTLKPAALQGTIGEIVKAVDPHTEAHPAAVLATTLARFGATVGNLPHVQADNRQHTARINPLIVGKTSTGAKGTASGVSNALFGEAEAHEPQWWLRRISGLSSGEGLIEAVRDGTGDNPDAKNFDEGISDKRLYVEEPEFASLLAVIDRKGSILPRVIREAWDGDILRTTTRSPLVATGAHITVVGHVTPGELRISMSEAQMVGGTMNRFLPVASRRTKLRPDGGNIPPDVLFDCGKLLADRVQHARAVGRMERTDTADGLWYDCYGHLRRERPDGHVAKILARAVPQVLRLSLTYALIDGHQVIDEPHLQAAIAFWDYVEQTAEWMFGGEIDNGDTDALVEFIATAASKGRTKTEISVKHFRRNKSSTEIDAMLTPLISDGRIRQETDDSGRGRPVTRYFAC